VTDGLASSREPSARLVGRAPHIRHNGAKMRAESPFSQRDQGSGGRDDSSRPGTRRAGYRSSASSIAFSPSGVAFRRLGTAVSCSGTGLPRGVKSPALRPQCFEGVGQAGPGRLQSSNLPVSVGGPQSINMVAGASRLFRSAWTKLAARRPSAIRWSNEDERFMVCRTTTAPSRTTGFSTIRFTPTIATSG